MRELEFEVLDRLLDDAESPWIIHRELVGSGHLSEDDVQTVPTTLEEMRERGWITIAIDADLEHDQREYVEARREGGMIDHLGPWYRITETGEREWKREMWRREN